MEREVERERDMKRRRWRESERVDEPNLTMSPFHTVLSLVKTSPIPNRQRAFFKPLPGVSCCEENNGVLSSEGVAR